MFWLSPKRDLLKFEIISMNEEEGFKFKFNVIFCCKRINCYKFIEYVLVDSFNVFKSLLLVEFKKPLNSKFDIFTIKHFM